MIKIETVTELEYRYRERNETMFEVIKAKINYSYTNEDNEKDTDYGYFEIFKNESEEIEVEVPRYHDLAKEDLSLIIEGIVKANKGEPVAIQMLPFSKLETKQKGIVIKVFEMLRDREVDPSGGFDKSGRFWAKNDHLISCRTPSRAYPYSQMTACRTKKYVTKALQFYGCKSVKTLLKHL